MEWNNEARLRVLRMGGWLMGFTVALFVGFLAGVGAMASSAAPNVEGTPLPPGHPPIGEALPPDHPAGHGLSLWVDVLSGEPVTYPDLVDDLAGMRVVYLGERHDVMRHHLWQAQIVTSLAERKVPLVLALEQIEMQYQPSVDRYNRGEIDFATLAREIDWEHRWPGYEVYRPAIEAAHEAGAPILALNARLETVRQVARGGGVAGLDARTRAELPAEMVLQDPDYERVLRMELPVHGGAGADRMRGMIEAQIVRDETMAQRLADFLQSDAGKGRTAVVLAGAGHVAYGLGTPSRVRRRMPGVKDRVIVFSESGEVKLSPEMKAMAQPVAITHDDLRAIGRPIADYLQVSAPPGSASPHGQ